MSFFTAIKHFIVERLILLICVGALVGVCFQSVAKLFNPLLLYFVMAVIYLGFLRVDFRRLRSELMRWPIQLFLLLCSLIITPFILFYFCQWLSVILALDVEYSVGVLLLFCAPTASLVPTITLVLGGRFERSVLNLVATSFTAPLTMPLMMEMVAGEYVAFDLVYLIEVLALLIVVPFIFAMITRLAAPNFKAKLMPNIPALAVLLLVCIEIGGLAGFTSMLDTDKVLLVKLCGLSFAVLVMAFTMGYWCLWRVNAVDKLVAGLIMTWSNLGLSIGIANMFFVQSAPEIGLFLTAMVLPWHLFLITVKLVSMRVSKRHMAERRAKLRRGMSTN